MAKAISVQWQRAAMALLIWGMAAPLVAQATGGVTGQAIGPQGKPLAGYTVVILDLDTHYATKTKTNNKGIYTSVGLPFHQYNLTLKDPSGKVLWTIHGQTLVLNGMATADFDLRKMSAEAGGGGAATPSGSWDFGGQQMTEWKGPRSGHKRKKIVALARQAEKEANAGQLAQAVADYEQALELQSPDAYLENALGIVYVKMHNVDAAAQAFQNAAEQDAKHAGQYYFNQGAVLENNGRMAAAAQAFKKCTEADPKNAEAYYWEGQALIAQAKTLPGGKVVAAPGTVEAYKNYLKYAPNGPHAAVARQILQTLSP